MVLFFPFVIIFGKWCLWLLVWISKDRETYERSGSSLEQGPFVTGSHFLHFGSFLNKSYSLELFTVILDFDQGIWYVELA